MRVQSGIQTDSRAYGLLVGLLVMLLGLVANASCGPIPASYGRGLEQRYDAAVEVDVTCIAPDGRLSGWRGSGVVVAADKVLTAAHVVATDPANLCVFFVTPRDGISRLMMPRIALVPLDLASLELVGTSPPFAFERVIFGKRPRLGAEVCVATAAPWRGHRCGEVQPYGATPGDLLMSALVEPGNSGSGVYNARGHLVGIVTHFRRCVNGQICGGRATSLDGHVEELLGRR